MAYREKENGIILRHGKRVDIRHASRDERSDELSILERGITIDFESGFHFPIVCDAEIDGMIRSRLDERMSAGCH